MKRKKTDMSEGSDAKATHENEVWSRQSNVSFASASSKHDQSPGDDDL
jgi:hypothetical protein